MVSISRKYMRALFCLLIIKVTTADSELYSNFYAIDSHRLPTDQAKIIDETRGSHPSKEIRSFPTFNSRPLFYHPQSYNFENSPTYHNVMQPAASNVFTVVGSHPFYPQTAQDADSNSALSSQQQESLPLSSSQPLLLSAKAPWYSSRNLHPYQTFTAFNNNGRRQTKHILPYTRARQELEDMRAKAKIMVERHGDANNFRQLRPKMIERTFNKLKPSFTIDDRSLISSEMNEDESTEWKHDISSANNAEEHLSGELVERITSEKRQITSSHSVESEELDASESNNKQKRDRATGSEEEDDKKENKYKRGEQTFDNRYQQLSSEHQPCRHPGCKTWITITFPSEEPKKSTDISDQEKPKKNEKRRPLKKLSSSSLASTTSTTKTTTALPPSTQRSISEFLFSTSWVVALKRVTTTTPVESSTASTSADNRTLERKKTVGRIKPFTLKTLPPVKPESITSATVGPSISISTTPPVSSAGSDKEFIPKNRNSFKNSSVINITSTTVAGNSLTVLPESKSSSITNNLDKTGGSRSQPWTHSSSRNDIGAKNSPKKTFRPKPTLTTDSTIEEAAIWASTELIDAIREVLEKFRAALIRGGPRDAQLHHSEPVDEQLQSVWNKLRAGSWLERNLVKLVMADATLLENLTNNNGANHVTDTIIATVLPSLLRAKQEDDTTLQK